ncbi:MAG: universal stress protein [Desulfobacterales bacterium]|jgi:nucleotide-binding universal stress UspA family protein
MFKNIVLAFDGSEYSHKALRCAKSLAERFEANLWLVHVFSNPSDLLGYTDYEKLFAKRKSAAQAVLDDARQKLGSTSFTVQDELREGSESESILKVAKNREADLIVMGTRGLGAVKGFLVGSVSRKVIHYAACPVMVVH